MTSNEILKADVLDIIFENRNKQYGAYSLRKNYNGRMLMSLVIALSIAFAVFLLINPKAAESFIPVVTADTLILTKVDVEPEQKEPIEQIEEPEQPRANETAAPQIRSTTIDIVEDHTITETDVPTQTELNENVISTTTKPGDGPVDNKPFVNEGNGNGNIIVPEEEPAIMDNNAVEMKAEFPGGMKKLADFLSRHLRTPDDLQQNETKTVRIKFIVNKDGEVTDFVVVRSGGNEFDKEVIRVLKKMPKWNPAKQNGKNVAVSFTQPVTFQSLEY